MFDFTTKENRRALAEYDRPSCGGHSDAAVAHLADEFSEHQRLSKEKGRKPDTAAIGEWDGEHRSTMHTAAHYRKLNRADRLAK